MDEEFDCVAGIDQIHQLIGGIPLKRPEHEHLTKCVGMIRQRLVKCGELEGAIAAQEAKKKHSVQLSRKRAAKKSAKK